MQAEDRKESLEEVLFQGVAKVGPGGWLEDDWRMTGGGTVSLPVAGGGQVCQEVPL